jgi:hypothetical protein
VAVDIWGGACVAGTRYHPSLDEWRAFVSKINHLGTMHWQSEARCDSGAEVGSIVPNSIAVEGAGKREPSVVAIGWFR